MKAKAKKPVKARTATKSRAVKAVKRERVMPKDIGFRTGDFVVYPTHGVGKVMGIETQEISGVSLQVEIQDAGGAPLPGFSLDECPKLAGDAIEHQLAWAKGKDVAALAGRSVRLRFVLKNADLYSLRFTP